MIKISGEMNSTDRALPLSLSNSEKFTFYISRFLLSEYITTPVSSYAISRRCIFSGFVFISETISPLGLLKISLNLITIGLNYALAQSSTKILPFDIAMKMFP